MTQNYFKKLISCLQNNSNRSEWNFVIEIIKGTDFQLNIDPTKIRTSKHKSEMEDMSLGSTRAEFA